MKEYTLTELATKTRAVVEATNSIGVVRIVRKLRGGDMYSGRGKGEESACFVVGVDEYRRLLLAANANAECERLKNAGLE